MGTLSLHASSILSRPFSPLNATGQCFDVQASGPPCTKKDTVIEKLFDLIITDSYRWMENLDDVRLCKWLRAEDADTDARTCGNFAQQSGNGDTVLLTGVSDPSERSMIPTKSIRFLSIWLLTSSGPMQTEPLMARKRISLDPILPAMTSSCSKVTENPGKSYFFLAFSTEMAKASV